MDLGGGFLGFLGVNSGCSVIFKFADHPNGPQWDCCECQETPGGRNNRTLNGETVTVGKAALKISKVVNDSSSELVRTN